MSRHDHYVDDLSSIIRSLCRKADEGWYLDIGANRPDKYSTTYWMYKSGFSGVAVDANPMFAESWGACRPRDLFFNFAVGGGSTSQAAQANEEIQLYVFEDDTLSTCSGIDAERYLARGERLISVRDVRIITVMDLIALTRYADMRERCVYMSVDIEGMEDAVLSGINFSIFRPTVIEVEVKNQSLAGVSKSPVGTLLRGNGYSPVAKGLLNVVFIDERSHLVDWVPDGLRG